MWHMSQDDYMSHNYVTEEKNIEEFGIDNVI